MDRDEGFVVNSDNLFRDHGSSRREGTSSAALSHDAIPAPDRPQTTQTLLILLRLEKS